MGGRSPDLHYVPYGDLAGAPNVVVDGSPADGTVLCLSHWPGIGSPPQFAADLSAEMAFSYLSSFDHHDNAPVVSNNHFDQDGLVGLFALTQPEAALERRDLLVEVARAGDFAVTSSRTAARVSMALATFADPSRSPLPGLPADYGERTAFLYTEMLGLLPQLCDDPDRWRDLWFDEDLTLRESIAAISSGAVVIEERPEVDLAVVVIKSAPGAAPNAGGHRFGGDWVVGLHPMAVCNATKRGALFTVRGRHYELAYRYESWVQFRSRAIRPRVDLAPLAKLLNEAEHSAGGSPIWTAEPVSALTPVLSHPAEVESGLEPDFVIDAVESHLRTALPAWDPYRITR